MRSLNQEKLKSPLVLIDPVDKIRNAAAAVSDEQFKRLITAAQQFLRQPSKRFFEEETVDVALLEKKYAKQLPHLVIIKATGKPGKPDITGTKIKQVYDFVIKKTEEFGIMEKSWHFDHTQHALLWLMAKKIKLEAQTVVQGPPVKLTEFVKSFKKKYRRTTVKNGRIYGYAQREHPELKSFLMSILQEPYIRERVTRITLLKP